MRSITTLTCVLAASVGLAACGGGDSDKQSSAAPPATTATTSETTPTTPTETPPAETGEAIDPATVKACIEDAGLKTEAQPDEVEGLQGKGFQVPLGEADFDDPSEDGTFAFFGYIYVFDTPESAAKFDGLASGSRFQEGEVHQNVYLGYNTEAAKVPSTPNGSKFIACVRG